MVCNKDIVRQPIKHETNKFIDVIGDGNIVFLLSYRVHLQSFKLYAPLIFSDLRIKNAR